MACLLTTGRSEPCRDAIGGLKAFYPYDFIEDSFTVASSVATAMSVSLTEAFKYDLLADGNTFNEVPTSDQNTGTTVYEQTLTVALKKIDVATAAELNLLIKARPAIVVLDRMGNYRVMGISDGTVASGDIASGGAKADFNGTTLTFTATETEPAPFLDAATVIAFNAVVSATVIAP